MTNQIKTIVFVGLTRSPVSVGFVQRFLDYLGEETGDQNDRFCGFRIPGFLWIKSQHLTTKTRETGDLDARLTRSPCQHSRIHQSRYAV